VRPKWPNDLFLGGRKVGGMLVEVSRGEATHAVVGVGLNVTSRATASAADLPLAAALYAEPELAPGRGARPPRETLLACILEGVERRLQEWSERRFERLVSDWERADVVVGRRLRLQFGKEVLEGRALGVTRAGLLRLETSAGSNRELAAGEVHLL
jgi:BirA family biotin operon repressor/biotin-[acetyl-CoA-carboxylase] ligase